MCMLVVKYPGYCMRCGATVELKDCNIGREPVEGGYRIFYICKYCGKEIEYDVAKE